MKLWQKNDLPHGPLEYVCPICWGKDQDEATADEDDAGQLHVTKHNSIHHDVISCQL